NFEFYICSRKIGSQRFLPRKKASALRLCRIFFGSKIASANFSAATRKLEIVPDNTYIFLVVEPKSDFLVNSKVKRLRSDAQMV
ncbi:MAG: hypothetical protein II957_07535, partial [Treponema sp.]|nr:hypothetical protein [Treponema sp.]